MVILNRFEQHILENKTYQLTESVGVSLGLKVGFAVVGLNVGEGVVSVY